MGIKFNCPQGHKLNVKSFLAGRRGICPHCEARFRIPMESGGTVEQIIKGERAREGDATRLTADMRDDPRPETTSTIAQATTYETAAAQPLGSPFTENVGVNPQAASAATGYASPTVADPISESPNAIWYVRPRSGGQYGPAAGDVLRGWISEGRVAGDSLVWCEGWPDWRQASSVFPQLAGAVSFPTSSPVGNAGVVGNVPQAATAMPQAAMPQAGAATTTAVGAAAPTAGALPVNVAGGVPTAAALPQGGTALPGGAIPGGDPRGGAYATSAPGSTPRRGELRRKSGSFTALIVVILILIALVLAGVFTWILMSQPESKTAWQSSTFHPNIVAVAALKPALKPTLKPA